LDKWKGKERRVMKDDHMVVIAMIVGGPELVTSLIK